jgi:methylated-DNA-[protein]-cysteine S-methyltransferase
MHSGDFNKKVWEALKLIPRGRVTTYKEIAKFVGRSRAARAVGNACNKNPFAPGVPCHRVVKSDGSIGGYASGSLKKKMRLEKEGVKIDKGKIRNFKSAIYKFK